MRMALFRTGHSEPSRLLIVVTPPRRRPGVMGHSAGGSPDRARSALAQRAGRPTAKDRFVQRVGRAYRRGATQTRGRRSGSWSPDEWRGACALPADFDFQPSDNIVANSRTATASLDEELTAAVAGGARGSARRADPTPRDRRPRQHDRRLDEWRGHRAGRRRTRPRCSGDEIDVSRTVGWFTTISHRLLRHRPVRTT